MVFKRKTCEIEGCSYPVWARKRCKAHDTKTKSYSTFKKKPKNVPEAYGFKSEKELFLHIWENRERTCAISGQDLNRFDAWKDGSSYQQSRFYSMFAHCLNKNQYKKFRLNPENVLLLHMDLHYLVDFGTIEQRNNTGLSFSNFYDKQEQLKQQYKQEHGNRY